MRGPVIAIVLLGTGLAVSASGCGATGTGPAAAGPTLLGDTSTAIPLAIGPGAGRPVIVVEGLGFDAPPRTLYEVLLEGRGGRRAPLGTISFFNETAPGYDGASGGGGGATRRFEASEALRLLGGEAVALVFVPSSGVTGTPPLHDPAARVRIGRVRVERR